MIDHASKRNAASRPFFPARLVLFCLILGLLTGCTSTRSKEPEPVEVLPAVLLHQYGRVVSVNQREGFVVLECTVLPNEGERITLFRGDQRVGRVRVHRIKTGRCAAAEIEEGTPRTGDRFREDRLQP